MKICSRGNFPHAAAPHHHHGIRPFCPQTRLGARLAPSAPAPCNRPCKWPERPAAPSAAPPHSPSQPRSQWMVVMLEQPGMLLATISKMKGQQTDSPSHLRRACTPYTLVIYCRPNSRQRLNLAQVPAPALAPSLALALDLRRRRRPSCCPRLASLTTLARLCSAARHRTARRL
eukprot:6190503-Pleurochrysis_carterae.AAC.1